MIDKDFTLYPEALELNRLGFNEPCFAYYKDGRITGVNKWDREDWGFHVITNKDITSVTSEIVIAPTYSQAFRWFREKHNLRSFVDTIVHDVDSPNDWIYYFQVKMGNGIDTQPYYSGDFNSYEEAELACLRKLIKKVKEKQK